MKYRLRIFTAIGLALGLFVLISGCSEEEAGSTEPQTSTTTATTSYALSENYADAPELDSDGDGLSDYDEIHLYGTDPTNPDSDGDGLDDFIEIKILKSDPLAGDEDGDGLLDGSEISTPEQQSSGCVDEDADSYLAYDSDTCPTGDDYCDDDPQNYSLFGCEFCTDNDGDGYGAECDAGDDCDDNDSAIHVGCADAEIVSSTAPDKPSEPVVTGAQVPAVVADEPAAPPEARALELDPAVSRGPQWPIPDTGQSGCFSNIISLTIFPVSGEDFYGQDAQYSINSLDSIDNGNGTVDDQVTGLLWQQESPDALYNVVEADAYCNGLVLGGHTDWRLPDNQELMTLFHYDSSSVKIESDIFPGTSRAIYWSSATQETEGSDGQPWLRNWGAYYKYGFMFLADDELLGRVRCVSGDVAGSAAHDYTDNADGTVTDNSTGLIWMQDTDDVRRTWRAGLDYCENLGWGGSNDWRLPNIKELAGLIDTLVSDPAIDTALFDQTFSASYWSSSTNFNYVDYAYVVNFYVGHIYDNLKGETDDIDILLSKENQLYVRCVR
jgi:Protein of unknown function (DUF1566)/Bacterial TSP3 repeat